MLDLWMLAVIQGRKHALGTARKMIGTKVARDIIRHYLPTESDSNRVGRIKRDQLRYLEEDGAPCEVCGGNIRTHPWADLAPGGWVVWCPFAPKGYQPIPFRTPWKEDSK